MPVSNRDQIKAGDQFERVYLGKRYTCEALHIGNGLGFRTWDGKEFRTLSTAGKHVIGTECNGYVWWNRAGDPPRRGPKPGTHNVRTLGTLKKVKSMVRKGTKHGAKPGSKPIRNITRSADQEGLRAGQRRYDCLVCAEPFVTTDDPPTVCPQGHEVTLPANMRKHLALLALR